ncbi:MAG: protein kinase [Spirochaetia bacterium]|nr:protein kinase [Spirochaetia bacterium]
MEKYQLAQLISDFEDRRPEAAARRHQLLTEIRARPDKRAGVFIGITGTPGAGKSTLIGALGTRLLAKNPDVRIAVVAIDPSSEVSGGALLGDRTRVRFPIDEARLFFRSQASDRQLGGMSPSTFQVCRLLHYFFDIVIIETVGIGQNEIEIQKLADRVYLILQPLAGDQVQFLKAGIMEIPQVFVLNKSDEEEAARKSYYALRASLQFVRPGEEDRIKIIRTSGITGAGLDELTDDILAFRNDSNDPEGALREKEVRYFTQWVSEEFGRNGKRTLEELGGASAFLNQNGDFDLAQKDFLTRIS